MTLVTATVKNKTTVTASTNSVTIGGADATVQLNGSTIGTVASGATGDFPVTQDGSPVGSWNGSAWIIPPDSGGGTLEIGIFSDAGHTTPITTTPAYTEVFIVATPSGFTPDNYLFFFYDGTEPVKIGEQSGGSISWTPTESLTNNSVYAVASDSVSDIKSWDKTAFEVTGDVDAQAFIAAAGITDPTQRAAINTLVFQLKTDSIWSKFHAIYPIVGGTAFSHKFNLINPLDTDAAFRLTFSGGWTHGATGATPNGTNAYADTHLVPATTLSIADFSLGYYSRTNIANGNDIDIAVGNYLGRYSAVMFLRKADDTAGFDSGNASSPNRITAVSQTDSRGMYLASIRATNDRILMKNGSTTLGIDTSPKTNALIDSSIIIGAYNQRDYGSPGLSPVRYSSKETALSSIGEGLTNTEISNYYTAVQAFQTTLSRNV